MCGISAGNKILFSGRWTLTNNVISLDVFFDFLFKRLVLQVSNNLALLMRKMQKICMMARKILTGWNLKFSF